MKRRDFLLTSSTGLVMAATAASAQSTMPGMPAAGGAAPMTPWDWTDQNGLARFLKVDAAPLENEFEKYPRCPYCGMMRKAFSQSRHLIVYGDDAVDGTCSIHCAGISLAMNMDAGPKAIYAGDAGAEGEVKPLADTAAMTYVIDPAKPGTMTAVSKWAYADAATAEAAAASPGAKAVGFDEALVLAFGDMAKDTLMIRKRRSEKRKQMGMAAPASN